MKKFIRGIGLISAAVLSVSAFSCADKKDDSKEVSESSYSKSERNEIIIATIYNDTNLDKAVKLFNKNSKDYEASVKLYTKEFTDEGLEDAVKQIQMDIISGNSPDIVSLTPEYIIPLVDNGYTADLYPLMEKCDGVKKEDILPNVFEGLERDGKLPAITIDFEVETVAAKTEIVGEDMENWTFEEAKNFFDSIPEDADFMFEYSGSGAFSCQNSIEDFFLDKISRECVDFKEKRCNFEGEFLGTLSFLNDLGSVQSVFARDDYDLIDRGLIDNKAFMCPLRLTGFNSIMSYDISAFDGADITYVGYPSANGCGAVVSSYNFFAILNGSKSQEASWEFINTFFTDDMQEYEYLFEFSILTERLEKSAHKVDKYNDFALKRPQNRFEKEYVIDDETIEQTLEYIKSLEMDFYVDQRVYDIIKEEYDAVLAGEKSPQECAEILDSRISLYISEKL